ncbi:MAG: hypothetical protein GXP25_15370 [Planctomycetes bacterium]|nr:hypothetical protein [Planctomycetota bacterium]
MSDIVFRPMVPLPVVVVLAGAALALVGYAYARGAGRLAPARRVLLALLRGMGIVAIAMILLNPMRPVPAEKTGEKPVLSVLLDTSRSMNVEDMDGESRLAVEKKLIYCAKPLFDDLSRDYEIELHEFSDKVSSLTADEFDFLKRADGRRTDLAGSILSVVDQAEQTRTETAGALILSDGHDNAGGDVDYAARRARSMDVPLWTCCIGTEEEAQDVSIVSRSRHDFVFVNQRAVIDADVLQQGYDRAGVTVRLLHENGGIAGEQWVEFKGRPKHTVSFPIIERKPGVVKYTLVTDPLDGEATVENNHRTIFLSVLAEKLKVLFLEGEPYWDSKFLAQALRRDPNVALTSIFRVGRSKIFAIAEDERGGAARPSNRIQIPYSRDELFAYDIVILGKLIDSMVDDDYVDLLKAFLTEKGGVLIFARGKPNLDGLPGLEKLSPLAWSNEGVRDVAVEITAEGRSNPSLVLFPGEPTDVVLRKLPPMLYAEKPGKQKSLAVTLAKARGLHGGQDGVPLVVFQRYGKGKTLAVSAAGLWRWAFLPDRLKQYDTVYARFWGQMLRWLVAEADFAPGSDVAFQTSAMSYSMGDEVTFYVRTRSAGRAAARAVEVRGPNGKTQEVALYPDPDLPGAYTASYFPRQQGEHTGVLKQNGRKADLKTHFAVYADSLEDLRCAAKPAVMKHLAELSGGATIPPDRLDSLRGLLQAREGKNRKDVRLADIWDQGPVFWLIAALFGIEWFLRRRSGLI